MQNKSSKIDLVIQYHILDLRVIVSVLWVFFWDFCPHECTVFEIEETSANNSAICTEGLA